MNGQLLSPSTRCKRKAGTRTAAAHFPASCSRLLVCTTGSHTALSSHNIAPKGCSRPLSCKLLAVCIQAAIWLIVLVVVEQLAGPEAASTASAGTDATCRAVA